MAGSIRFIKNMYLNVEIDGESQKIPFGFGEFYPIDYLKADEKEGYYDIVFKDGSVAAGVKQEGLFEKRDATIVKATEKIVPIDFEEIDFDKFETKEEEKTIFDWTKPS